MTRKRPKQFKKVLRNESKTTKQNWQKKGANKMTKTVAEKKRKKKTKKNGKNIGYRGTGMTKKQQNRRYKDTEKYG